MSKSDINTEKMSTLDEHCILYTCIRNFFAAIFECWYCTYRVVIYLFLFVENHHGIFFIIYLHQKLINVANSYSDLLVHFYSRYHFLAVYALRVDLKVHKHEIFFSTFFAETETIWSQGPATRDF
jgi:hypothetical protein